MRRAWLIIPVALLAVGALLWSQRQTGAFFVSGILEADDIGVGSRVGGRVREVRVQEGQTVAPGDVLIVLDPFDLHERLAEARALRAAQQAALERLEAGYRPEEIAQAQARRGQAAAMARKMESGLRPIELQILRDKLEVAKAELTNATAEHERVKRLWDDHIATKQEMDDAIRQLATADARHAQAVDELKLGEEGNRAEDVAHAQANLAEAQAALALLETGPRKEDIAEARARAESAAGAVAALEQQLKELTIVAPVAAYVDAIDLRPGDLIASNAPVARLIEPERLWVRAYVPENRLNLALGQKVALRADSLPNKRFAGEIVFIARQAEFMPSNVQTPEERSKQVFRIKARPIEGRDALRAGMAVDVYFEAPP